MTVWNSSYSFHNCIQSLIKQELLLIWLEPLQDNSRGTVQNWTLLPWQATERDTGRTPQFSSVLSKMPQLQVPLQTWRRRASLCLPHSQHKGRNKELGHCCITFVAGEWVWERPWLPRHPLHLLHTEVLQLPNSAHRALTCTAPGAKRNSRDCTNPN